MKKTLFVFLCLYLASCKAWTNVGGICQFNPRGNEDDKNLEKKHFCAYCDTAAKAIKFSVDRNKHCISGRQLCQTSGINTVFMADIGTFLNRVTRAGNCLGDAPVDTWHCTNIPRNPDAAFNWDTSASRCIRNRRGGRQCIPGPVLPNGHFNYRNLVC